MVAHRCVKHTPAGGAEQMIVPVQTGIVPIRRRHFDMTDLVVFGQDAEIAVHGAAADLVILCPDVQINLVGGRVIASIPKQRPKPVDAVWNSAAFSWGSPFDNRTLYYYRMNVTKCQRKKPPQSVTEVVCMAEEVAFETATCPVKDNSISSRARYDHFDTLPNECGRTG